MNNQFDDYIDDIHQVGTFQKYSQIDGFMINAYRASLKQILEYKSLFGIIFFLELLSVIVLITLLLIDDFTNNIRFILIIYAIQLVFTQIQNGSYYKRKKEQHLIENMYIYITSNVLLSIFQQDYILFLRFCRIELNYNSQNYSDNLLRYKYYHFLIKWFSTKKLFILIKAHLIFIYIVTVVKSQQDYVLVFYIGLLAYLSIQYLMLHTIYINIFIFQKKQNLFLKVIIFFESAFCLVQSYCYVCQIILNVIQLFAFIAIMLIYTFFLSCQLQYNDIYNPLHINIFQQILMGQNLVYISSLYNNDILQYEIFFQNYKNLVQFCSCQFYFIITCYLVYFFEDYQLPYSIIVIQFLLIVYSILIALLKVYYITKLYVLNKSQYVQSISDINALTSAQKCRNVIFVKEQLKPSDNIAQHIDFKNQFDFIYLDKQFSLQQINGYSIMHIFSLNSICLVQAYTMMLKNSKRLNIRLNLAGQQINKQIMEQLFTILKLTSITDQSIFNIENSDITKQFNNINIYQDLIKCFKENNYYKTILHIIAYKQNISAFQIINPDMILFDLFDNIQ